MANDHTFAPPARSGPANSKLPVLAKGRHIVIIGAGAFGTFSALFLQRHGARVTLVDPWGPGNSRSSSGDETRVIRSTYGANAFYFDLNVRAIELWKELERSEESRLFFNTGVLWFCYKDRTPLVDDSIPFARKHNMEYQYLTPKELSERYPDINTSDLHHAWFDPYGGYLLARTGVQCAFDRFMKEGGSYIQQEVSPCEPKSGLLDSISLADGTRLHADVYLFACGSWLGKIVPGMRSYISCTRQEVYYFGTPAEHAASVDNLPVWVDADGEAFYYGIPGNLNRGFKVGVDLRGPIFDPTHDDRTPNKHVLEGARLFMSRRFPAMRSAPVIEGRVCPYESSPDGNFIFDLMPAAENALVLGGGSGHGFKHGPALGELVSKVLFGIDPAPACFALDRFHP